MTKRQLYHVVWRSECLPLLFSCDNDASLAFKATIFFFFCLLSVILLHIVSETHIWNVCVMSFWYAASYYPFLCSVCNWPFVVLRRSLNAVSGLWLIWLSSKGSVIQCTPLHTQLKRSNADISWGIFRYLFIWRGWPRSCTALLFFSINSVLSCNLCA